MATESLRLLHHPLHSPPRVQHVLHLRVVVVVGGSSSFHGCCTIVIIGEHVCTITGPLPLFFRPLIGRNDLMLLGLSHHFSVSFTLPHRLAHCVARGRDKFSIPLVCAWNLFFRISMYALERGNQGDKNSQGVLKIIK